MKFNKAIIKDHLQDIRLMDCRDLEFCTDIWTSYLWCDRCHKRTYVLFHKYLNGLKPWTEGRDNKGHYMVKQVTP